jgi:hypothetical protein
MHRESPARCGARFSDLPADPRFGAHERLRGIEQIAGPESVCFFQIATWTAPIRKRFAGLLKLLLLLHGLPEYRGTCGNSSDLAAGKSAVEPLAANLIALSQRELMTHAGLWEGPLTPAECERLLGTPNPPLDAYPRCDSFGKVSKAVMAGRKGGRGDGAIDLMCLGSIVAVGPPARSR